MDGVRRPWTRVGIVAMAAHVFYELAAGVGMPGASRLGPAGAAGLWGAGTVAAFDRAGRPGADAGFAVLNGTFLAAVLAHFAAWPRVRPGVPWLAECEGLSGRLMPAYNVVLLVSGVCAVGGLREHRGEAALGLAAPVLLTPLAAAMQHREHASLLLLADRHPGWWNRRLQGR